MKRPRPDGSAADDSSGQPTKEHHHGSQESGAAGNQGRKKDKFIYGNYHRYYGYRVGDHVSNDLRVRCLQRQWFEGKECLDIGCNEGVLTIYMAQHFHARRMLGVDIDKELINEGYKPLRQVSRAQSASAAPPQASAVAAPSNTGTTPETVQEDRPAEGPQRGEGGGERQVPAGVTAEDAPGDRETCGTELCHSGIPGEPPADGTAADLVSNTHPAEPQSQQQGDQAGEESVRMGGSRHQEAGESSEAAPVPATEGLEPLSDRIHFLACNVLAAKLRESSFDVVTCLSVTKWVHLNWGDRGIIDLFFKIYSCLRTGGILILEPQPWKSYAKNKGVSQVARKHFEEISIHPEEFREVLLDKIGFLSCQVIAQSIDPSKGFGRPLYLFRK